MELECLDYKTGLTEDHVKLTIVERLLLLLKMLKIFRVTLPHFRKNYGYHLVLSEKMTLHFSCEERTLRKQERIL